MIERTLWVKEIAYKKDKKDRDYATVTLVNDELRAGNYAVYPGEVLNVLKKAHEDSLAINAKLDKNGNYWNLMEAALMSDAIKQAQAREPPTNDMLRSAATPITTSTPPSEPPQAKSSPVSDKDRQIAPQELGMWLKELGESIRSGHLEKSYPNRHVAITAFYYQKMFEVIGIKP